MSGNVLQEKDYIGEPIGEPNFLIVMSKSTEHEGKQQSNKANAPN